MTARIFQDSRGLWRWSLIVAKSGAIAIAPQGYRTRADCVAALEILRDWGSESSTVD